MAKHQDWSDSSEIPRGEARIVGGGLRVLNVGHGDLKLSFDPKNSAERIRAARIVTDMLRRGYALLVEVRGRGGKKQFVRATAFDEAHCEYIVADFDPLVATAVDKSEEKRVEEQRLGAEATEESPSPGPSERISLKDRSRRVPAESTRAVGVARSAGG